MTYNRDVFANLMPQIDAFVKHLVCHRAIQRQSDRLPKCIYWSLTSNAHLLQAIVCWCKVFGATGMNDTHWLNLNPTEATKLRDSFRNGLHSTLGLDLAAWDAYGKEVTNFRNGYAAHTEIRFSQPVPDLDLAMKIAFFFDDWVRLVIAPNTLDEPRLEDLAGELQTTMEVYVASLA